jgi:hypothetical protein
MLDRRGYLTRESVGKNKKIIFDFCHDLNNDGVQILKLDLGGST